MWGEGGGEIDLKYKKQSRDSVRRPPGSPTSIFFFFFVVYNCIKRESRKMML